MKKSNKPFELKLVVDGEKMLTENMVSLPRAQGASASSSLLTASGLQNHYFNGGLGHYQGAADRISRYARYDEMDRDSDVARALDIISEHVTERGSDRRMFNIDGFGEDIGNRTSEILMENSKLWASITGLDKRLFHIVRNMLKYGDWFIFRNPDTHRWYDVHPATVEGAIVNPDNMEIVGWLVKNFVWNVDNMSLDEKLDNAIVVGGSNATPYVPYRNFGGQSASTGESLTPIPAEHILHFTMNIFKYGSFARFEKYEHDGSIWPFGISWLENIFKTFYQRQQIEEASIIHRIQRAPTRFVWYIDIGRQRPDKAQQEIVRFRNSLTMKRQPGNLDGMNTLSSVYNPMSQLEDYFIPIKMDQRGSKVDTLEGTPWNDLPELEHFTKKLMSSLRVPYAWLLPNSEGGYSPSDGKIGTATQEEVEFSRFCRRIQDYINPVLDKEFKVFCEWRELNIDADSYVLTMFPPTDYEAYRDRQRLDDGSNIVSNLKTIPGMSTRWLLKNVLGLTDSQISENERMWLEEHGYDVSPDAEHVEPSSSREGGDDFGMGGDSKFDIRREFETDDSGLDVSGGELETRMESKNDETDLMITETLSGEYFEILGIEDYRQYAITTIFDLVKMYQTYIGRKSQENERAGLISKIYGGDKDSGSMF